MITKPATWHCSEHDGEGDLIKEQVKNLTTERRKALAEELMTQRDTPALTKYIILRFGMDPSLKDVMNSECLFGLVHRLDVGTSGALLMGKNKEGFEFAKQGTFAQER